MIKGVVPKNRKTNPYYTPKYPTKYFGNYPIVLRSSYERKFCIFLDSHPNVIKWSSEPDFSPFPIRYIGVDNKEHRYYPDFLMWYKHENNIYKYCIEVKPKTGFTQPKIPTKRKGEKESVFLKRLQSYYCQLRDWQTNVLKKQAAENICKSIGYIYKIVDEDWLLLK
jgi:hypothetical protein